MKTGTKRHLEIRLISTLSAQRRPTFLALVSRRHCPCRSAPGGGSNGSGFWKPWKLRGSSPSSSLGSPPQHRAIRDAHFGQTEQLASEYHQLRLPSSSSRRVSPTDPSGKTEGAGPLATAAWWGESSELAVHEVTKQRVLPRQSQGTLRTPRSQ